MKQETWKAGEFDLALKGPWKILAHSNSVSRRKEGEKPSSGQEPYWEGEIRMDKNLAPLH
jgi:hypothetical protein